MALYEVTSKWYFLEQSDYTSDLYECNTPEEAVLNWLDNKIFYDDDKVRTLEPDYQGYTRFRDDIYFKIDSKNNIVFTCDSKYVDDSDEIWNYLGGKLYSRITVEKLDSIPDCECCNGTGKQKVNAI